MDEITDIQRWENVAAEWRKAGIVPDTLDDMWVQYCYQVCKRYDERLQELKDARNKPKDVAGR